VQAVDSGGIAVKQFSTVCLQKTGNNFPEPPIDSLEATAEPVDWKIAGKHAAVDTKNFDCGQDDLSVVGDQPG
jgi:hypothetical protein